MIERFKRAIQAEVNGVYLAVFRIMMGIVLLKESHRIYKSIFSFYIEPDLQIKWPFLEWLPLLPEKILYSGATLIGICAVFIIVGFFSRIASLITAFIYGYFLFLDCSYYNNHYYLIFLVLLILSICSQDHKWSISEKIWHYTGRVPAWNVALLRFQITLVYLFGGLSKLNKDWLSGNTMRTSIEAGAYQSILEIFSDHKETAILVLTHGGWIFDLLVPVLLLYNKTRWWVIPFIAGFHLINIFNLNIGVFPYMMFGSSIMFFGDGVISQYRKKDLSVIKKLDTQRLLVLLIPIYMLFQLLFPMRHLLLGGDYNITGEGYNFSWKMKGNAVELQQYDFYMIDKKANDTLDIAVNLHQKQFNRLYLSPSSNIYLAHYFKNKISDNHLAEKNDLIVNVHVRVSVNGRQAGYLINPVENLLKYKYSSVNQLQKIIIYN